MNFSKGEEYVMNTYGRFPIVLDYGKGSYVFDTNGKKYLDFVAGIAVNSLGHAHEKLSNTISEQSQKLLHVSNLYWTKPQMDFAEKLINHYEFDRVFFCNSGAESVEGALKLVRKYSSTKNKNKTEIIAMENSFHGRTYAAVTATGQAKYQKGFSPLMPGIHHVPFNDFEALMEKITTLNSSEEKVGAILLEPIQGEGGITPCNKEYLQKVRDLCTEKDILLVFDEVQCGAGRTGYYFAGEYFGISPDICCMAKGIAGGVPMGAMLTKQFVADSFSPGDHASTFGGNSLASACGNLVFDELTSSILENVKIQSEYFISKLNELAKEKSSIKEVRGVGLLLGIETHIKASEIVSKSLEKSLLLIGAGDNVVRFVPPLNVSKDEIDECLSILKEIL